MRLVNLTPHTITIRCADGSTLSLPSEGNARVSQTSGRVLPGYWGAHGGEGEGPYPVYSRSLYGPITGLPETTTREEVYVVSLMVLERAAEEIHSFDHLEDLARTMPDQYVFTEKDAARRYVLSHLVAPGTGPSDEAIRYPEGHPRAGQIEAVTRLISVTGTA